MTEPDPSPPAAAARADIWGGLECSVVRVGERLRDQFRETGHHDRLADLEAAASLGVTSLRYPVSWERVAPDWPQTCDWAWHDERLTELRRLGIAPIVGLVHHGSGPAYTNLLDPAFPEKLADFAARVARRYPWVQDWTPVNEPLTTARFSGLYGHWFPHRADEASFLRMLANQCRAVQLAMAAIRREIPHARLVQTEDLGRTFATAKLQYQADYENERRWLSLDLLLGRVGPSHPFHGRLRRAGVAEAELEAMQVAEAGNTVLGFNHYVTSERFLDHRTALYAPGTHGGNGRDRYADTEAVRVPAAEGQTGWLPRLREAWQRFPDMPLAVTEAHIGCTEDQQVRWLAECWQALSTLRAEGADLRAMTVWALFGAVDWCTLLTRSHGRYEPGAFHAPPGAVPRMTGVGHAVASLAGTGRIDHEAATEPGWWSREDRFHPELRLTG